MNSKKQDDFQPRKQPIYTKEGYPSNTCDTIFRLYMETVQNLVGVRTLSDKSKDRIVASAREPLHVCLN